MCLRLSLCTLPLFRKRGNKVKLNAKCWCRVVITRSHPSHPSPHSPVNHREGNVASTYWFPCFSAKGDVVLTLFNECCTPSADCLAAFRSACPRRYVGATASPWTITHRPFENNVHKVTYTALPLLALLRLADPGLFGVALGVAFLFGSLMSNVRTTRRDSGRCRLGRNR